MVKYLFDTKLSFYLLLKAAANSLAKSFTFMLPRTVALCTCHIMHFPACKLCTCFFGNGILITEKVTRNASRVTWYDLELILLTHTQTDTQTHT